MPMSSTTKRIARAGLAFAALAAVASAVANGRLYGTISNTSNFYQQLDKAASFAQAWWQSGNIFNPGSSFAGAPAPFGAVNTAGTGASKQQQQTVSSTNCQTIFQVMESRSELSRIRAIEGTLSQQLRNQLISTAGDQFTVFLPNDNAINNFDRALGEGGNPQWRRNTNEASALFAYHVVPGAAVFANQLSNGQFLYNGLVSPTSGSFVPPLLVSKQNDVIIQGVGSEAAVVTPDIPICRGVVHIVDQVLIPVELSASSSEQSVQAERQELSRVQGTNQQYQQQNRQQQGQSNMMGEQQQGGMMGGGQQQQGGFANAPRSFASQP